MIADMPRLTSRIALAGTLALAASALTVGVASADANPSIASVQLSSTSVQMTATTDTTLAISVDVLPGDTMQPISSVHADLAAEAPGTEPAVTNEASSDLTSTDGEHWSSTVVVPRNAATGSWTIDLTATDAAAGTGTSSTSFVVLQRTTLSLKASPASAHATGTVTFSGSLKRMQPAESPTAAGTYVAYSGQTVNLSAPGRSTQRLKTSSAGTFTYTTTVTKTATWTASFAGNTARASSEKDLKVTVAKNSTRITKLNASPEPVYRNGYVNISGTLQRNDPNGDKWLPYKSKTVVVYRNSTSAYKTTAKTDSKGHFSVTVRGIHAARAGTWYASFAGTSYNASSKSHGDKVSTKTAPLRITHVVYDSPGSDFPVTNHKLNAEVVTITNKGSHIANLYDWIVSDADGHAVVFEVSVYIHPGKSVRIHTGSGRSTSKNIYLGYGYYIWNNDGDTAYLVSDRDSIVDKCKWGAGRGSTSC